ncbi:MAG: inorganic phosphate transporter [Alphaproteobacteria bacterium]|nr:inorganic phosphate transporter [Alphaproteobacteria bacterium]
MISFLFFLSSGMFLGWSLGANDGANIFGTAVGTKMIRFKTAAIIASFFIVLGAVLAGAGAAETLNELGDINALAGAFMAELAAALTIYFMVRARILTSTSQAIVGAIIGWNIYSSKPTDLSLVSKIAATWIICPVLSGIFAVVIYYLIKSLLKVSRISLLKQDACTRVGLILAGAFGAYALGANNMANVMGVFVGSNMLHALPLPYGLSLSPTQVLFLLGGIAVAVGIFTYSRKTMDTVGRNIMQMSPMAALIVVIAQSLVLFLFASPNLHNFLVLHNLPTIPLVPVSSSQAVIGAVMAIGLIKGGAGINWHLIAKILVGWVITPILSALICYISLFVLANVFTLQVYY